MTYDRHAVVRVAREQKHISGPLLDRLDIHIEVARVPYEKLASDRQGESWAVVRERVSAARVRQNERFKGTRLLTNAEMGGRPRYGASARWMGPGSG